MIVDSGNICPGPKTWFINGMSRKFPTADNGITVTEDFLISSFEAAFADHWQKQNTRQNGQSGLINYNAFFSLLFPFGYLEVAVSLILVSEDLNALSSHFSILSKFLGRGAHVGGEEKMSLHGYREGWAGSLLKHNRFSCCALFLCCKGEGKKASPI